jgi:hypothetical protein
VIGAHLEENLGTDVNVDAAKMNGTAAAWQRKAAAPDRLFDFGGGNVWKAVL